LPLQEAQPTREFGTASLAKARTGVPVMTIRLIEKLARQQCKLPVFQASQESANLEASSGVREIPALHRKRSASDV
jgi:hypothetical protein